MVASVLRNITLDDSQPGGMLPYDKNCVAMTFSRLLGVGVYATINFFLQKQWIKNAKDLENDNTIELVIGKLDLQERYKKQSWATVKTGMQGMPDGRYFATNWGIEDSKAKAGHAFAIIKKGGVGVAGNNAEDTDRPYHSQISDSHLISVYGPIG